MPAILGEAFVSPFDNHTKTKKKTEDEDYYSNIITEPSPMPYYQQSDQPYYSQPIQNPPPYVSQDLNFHPTSNGCDRLILDLMSCPECRKKLVELIRNDNIETRFSLFMESKWSPVIINIAIAIFFLFCVDRIIKYRFS
jgi:uncharacterized protein YbaR (Trm112 family)